MNIKSLKLNPDHRDRFQFLKEQLKSHSQDFPSDYRSLKLLFSLLDEKQREQFLFGIPEPIYSEDEHGFTMRSYSGLIFHPVIAFDWTSSRIDIVHCNNYSIAGFCVSSNYAATALEELVMYRLSLETKMGEAYFLHAANQLRGEVCTCGYVFDTNDYDGLMRLLPQDLRVY